MIGLAEAASPPRSDLHPDFLLGRLRLSDYAEAQANFERQYLDTVTESVAALPYELAITLLRDAYEAVKKQEFALGRPLFDENAQAPGGVLLLHYLMLRVKHSDMTRGKADELADNVGLRRVTDVVSEIMGYTTPNFGPPSKSTGPVQWDKVIASLRVAMGGETPATIEEVMGLTLEQAQAYLETPQGRGRNVTNNEIQRRQLAAMAAFFSNFCTVKQLSPPEVEQMAKEEPDKLVAMVGEMLPGKPVDRDLLLTYARNYVQRLGGVEKAA